MLLALLLLAPGTAWAATGDIGCIEAGVGPDTVRRIGASVVAAADKGGEFGTAFDTDRDALLTARDRCKAANNWSQSAVQAAVSYLQGRATRLGAEAALKADGLDPGKLAERYAALPALDRKTLIAKASSTILKAVRASATNDRQRRHVMLYFAGLAAIEFYPAEFAQS